MDTFTEHARTLVIKSAEAHDSSEAMRFSQAATNVTNAAATIAMLERDAGGAPNIRRMVDRFLAWKLPFDFRPDGGIEFNARYHNGTPEGGEHKPTGTNLLTAVQAEEMIRHLLG